MPNATKDEDAAKIFLEAVTGTRLLRWLAGLQAVKKSEGGGQIACEEPKRLLGGAAIDDDCRAKHPQSSRWDYVLGYRRSKSAVAFFIEVHSAETSAVSKMKEKLDWLEAFLAEEPQAPLAALTREVHWVASGRINIPKTTPQYRFLKTALFKRGLQGPVKLLTLT